MFIKYSEEAQKILKKAKIEMQKLKHAFIGSEHLILSILNSNNYVSNKLNEYGVCYNLFQKELIKKVGIGKSVNNYFIYTPLLKRVLQEAILDTKELNNKEVSIETIFLAILDEGEGVAIRVLESLGVNIDGLYEELCNKTITKKISHKLSISECSVDLTKKAKDNLLDPLIGREKEVNEIIEILLRRNKNNPLLIGEAGVGKTAIVEELARRIINGDVPDKLRNMRIFSLSMSSCVSGTKYRGEFEERINKILKELENNSDIILFIDEIHTIVGAGGAEGAIDAANIFKPALARGNIKVIGATTINEYKSSFGKDKALTRRFQTVIIKENTIDETKNILYNLKSIYEDYHHVIIKNEIIDSIIMLAEKYFYDKKNPDKSLDILDMVCSSVSLKKSNIINKLNELEDDLLNLKKQKNDLIIKHQFTKAFGILNDEMKIESKINTMSLSLKKKKRKIIKMDDVINVVENITNIPIFEGNKNINKLTNLEKHLNKIIIGQENVINTICQITKKIMLGMKDDLPYSFLFTGSSGVGKTLLAKEYSKYLNIPLIRLDMSEYKESHSISKIIGSPPGYVGYNDYENVLEKVKNNPFCVILLDEIEKASSEVINLFLQILDEGIITNAKGNMVSFKNTIIIMTSNIGSENESIGFNKIENKENEIRKYLSTIFVNRINKICYFNKLTKNSIKRIIESKIKSLTDKYQKYHIKISVNDKTINSFIMESEYNIYGARKINKIIEDKIDNLVIDGLLNKQKKIIVS